MVVSLVHPQLSHYGHNGCWFTLALVMDETLHLFWKRLGSKSKAQGRGLLPKIVHQREKKTNKPMHFQL
jgi:hypothetical protein